MRKRLVLFASRSDSKTYDPITSLLKKNKISFDFRLYSAHKTPEEVDKIIRGDYSIIISGAGLAAHLPGVAAARVLKPVIGVPCEGNYQGLDALLSIAQMPPGIPVLAVGVSQGKIAAQNCAKMMKKYESVTLIGDKKNAAVKKAEETLKRLNAQYTFSNSPNPKTVNIIFTEFDEPAEKKDELVIYCPLLTPQHDRASTALNFLKHTSHGLWVGINNGVNAAVAAVEILNFDNEFEEKLVSYRREMGKKVL